MTFTTFVPGIPRPKGSKTAAVTRDGRPYLFDSDSGLKAWERKVVEYCNAQLGDAKRPVFMGPVKVQLTFVYEDLKSSPKRYWKATAPDGDKLERAVWDALTKAEMWEDDARVVDWSGLKLHKYAELYNECGVYITVDNATELVF